MDCSQRSGCARYSGCRVDSGTGARWVSNSATKRTSSSSFSAVSGCCISPKPKNKPCGFEPAPAATREIGVLHRGSPGSLALQWHAEPISGRAQYPQRLEPAPLRCRGAPREMNPDCRYRADPGPADASCQDCIRRAPRPCWTASACRRLTAIAIGALRREQSQPKNPAADRRMPVARSSHSKPKSSNASYVAALSPGAAPSTAHAPEPAANKPRA